MNTQPTIHRIDSAPTADATQRRLQPAPATKGTILNPHSPSLKSTKQYRMPLCLAALVLAGLVLTTSWANATIGVLSSGSATVAGASGNYTYTPFPSLATPSNASKLVVTVQTYQSSGGTSINSITYNNANLTAAVEKDGTSTQRGTDAIYYLDNPSGPGDIVITVNQTGTSQKGIVTTYLFLSGTASNVSQTGTNGPFTPSTATETVTVNSVPSGSLVVAANYTRVTSGTSSPTTASPLTSLGNAYLTTGLSGAAGYQNNVSGSVSSSFNTPTGFYTIGVAAAFAPGAATPTISSASPLSGSLSTIYGTASGSASSAVSGTNLTADITATAQTGFEVATAAGGPYSGTVTITQSGGIASGTLYVRLAATATVGTYNSTTAANLTSTGATSVNVATTSGGNTVAPATPIIAATSPLSGSLSAILGTASGSAISVVSGQYLTAGITATAHTNFEVSSDNGTFGSTATFSQSGGTLYVRLAATAPGGTYNSLTAATLSSNGATDVDVLTTSGGNAVTTPSSVTTWPTAAASIRLGHPLSSTTLSGGSGTPTPGTFDWTTPTYQPVALGTQAESVTYTPGNTNYGPTTGTANVTVTGGSGMWNVTYSGNWSDGSKWLGNDVADGVGTTGTFFNDLQSNSTVTLDSTSRTLGIMNAASGSGRSLSFAATNGATLTFDTGSSQAAQLNMRTESGNSVYFYMPVHLNSSLDISNSSPKHLDLGYGTGVASNIPITNISSGAVTLSNTNTSSGALNIWGPVSDGTNGGTVAVAQNGTSVMTLYAANTYSGGTTVSNGTLNFTGFATQPSSGNLAISAGATVNLNGSVMSNTWPKASVTGAGTLNQPISFSGFGVVVPDADMSGYHGIWNISGSGEVTVQSPFVSPASDATIKVGSGVTLYLGYYHTTVLGCDVELYGADDGEGFGQLRVEDDNRQNGRVILKANSSIGSDSDPKDGGTGYIGGAISNVGGIYGLTKVGKGTVTLTGANNTYTGATTVNQGTLALVGGSQASPITVSAGASLGFTLGSPTTSTSTFNLSAGTIKISGTPTLGSYLLTTSTGITGTPTLDTPISGYALQVIGNALYLVQTGGGFSVWINGIFANGATVPADQRGPNDDPDHDGISNLVEYAVAGQDPTVANATIGTFDGTTLSFTKRAGTTGLTYAIEQSTDLGTWAEVPAGPSYVNNSTTISYALTPGSPARNFIRLKVSQAP